VTSASVPAPAAEVVLRFAAGTIVIEGLPADAPYVPVGVREDTRAGCLRAPAMLYADVVRALVRAGVPYRDEARAYAELPAGLRVAREPRDYQREALAAWVAARGRGVVVLPTGAGKSLVAVLAIAEKRRSALVVAPTLDLCRQWYDLLGAAFGVEIGVVGGGEHRVLPITVTTYDSAYVHMEHLGARFGMVVFDECHHLPGDSYSQAALLCLAPYRLALTATPERTDGREARLDELVGPVVYRKDILELSGSYLAEYDTQRIVLGLGPAEREEYASERAVYLDFVRGQGIRMGSPSGWADFILRTAVAPGGRRALAAYRRQRQLAFASPAKIDCLAGLLDDHRLDRTIVFTLDNATAHEISSRFLVPTITHQTRVTERSEILRRFAEGSYGVVATSRVLNEGVDVPDANVAVVMSGSGSVREHVQRLGRILRPREGKRAVLYELVSEGTVEAYTSERRREHDAYR